MAQLSNVADMYLQNAIKTASPAKLTLMLYDGAVKFSNIALEAMQDGKIEKTNTYIQKVQKIIVELRVTLDMKYPVSQEFDTVYDYIYRRLVEANMKKDEEILKEALKHIKTMRDTWKEVMRINNVS
ncbi:MAG: flagellar export chaperone FliS [Clostridiaceae bacterium]|nr:flagellar export chaperone FliS [Clostridiaceae bacterium]